MRKAALLGIILMAFVVGLCSEASAGLINYDRLKKRSGGAPAEQPARKGYKKEVQGSRRDWMKTEPAVKNNVERRYDINRDGKLQTAEVKILLRDVVDEVESKGRYSVYNSDVLVEYDTNKDRIINSFEADEIRKDVR